MRKLTNEKYRETYYEETLDNGLHVVLWNKPDYIKSLFMMVTPLGAMDLKQIDDNKKEYEFPAGIAHFLEHKMFEMEDHDVMDMFSKMGANVNAFTSYTETAYHFTTSGEIEEPLDLLLDFVQNLSISEESVEKEKGIIIQELNMYKQMSDQRLLMEVFTSLFQKHPLKYDIGGDANSVTSTTRELLETCYKTNYHPSTMVLVGVTSKDPMVVMEIIKKNQEKKSFDSIVNVHTELFEEPREVAREDYTFEMDVKVPKIAIAYKLSGIKDPYQRAKEEWCIKILLDTYFSDLNKDYQRWMDDEIINDYFGSEVDYGEDYGYIMLYCETKKINEFKKIVQDTLEIMMKSDIDIEVMEQLKRRYYGQTVRSLNSFDNIAITFARNFFEGMDFFKVIDGLYQITTNDIESACQRINLENTAIVTLNPKKNN